MVDYIEQIKAVEIRIEKHDKGFKPVLLIFDVHGAVLKESEYEEELYADTVQEAYEACIEKMKSIL